MTLSEEVKTLIRKEYKEFENFMYAGKTKEQRDELAQFFTPPEISIKLIEELSDLKGSILDPTSGSGNLLAAAIIAGADVTKVFGNDYDGTMVELCRSRIKEIPDRLEVKLENETEEEYTYALKCATKIRVDLNNFQDYQIHQGNASHEFALTYFGNDYEDYYFGSIKEDYAKTKRLNNLKQIKLAGSLNLFEYELDHKIYNSIKFKEAHVQEYNEHVLAVNNRIQEEIAQAKDKPFAGDLW